MAAASIQYSEKYFDDIYEYRCVLRFAFKEREREEEDETFPPLSSHARASASCPRLSGAGVRRREVASESGAPVQARWRGRRKAFLSRSLSRSVSPLSHATSFPPLVSSLRPPFSPCRHVVLPPEIASHLPKNRLLDEVRPSPPRPVCSRVRTHSATPYGPREPRTPAPQMTRRRRQSRRGASSCARLETRGVGRKRQRAGARHVALRELLSSAAFSGDPNRDPLRKHNQTQQNEWRALGVQQSRGWVHYAIHRPEPHIMLFR